ncbi:hypothetical protein DM01DRAFT_1386276 [Hesseltinella vesiculosa]|uniref:UDENN domain-containing protein n=1 Tax=Hesseltinella vesiculosa TaxID=101127 RepID=A0A1X2G6H3_9FUNG|nr:hypothetical protein DM01DRAFT_1386276 [Hesseltinella vesiculosa]
MIVVMTENIEDIKALFFVRFHYQRGNELAWQYPPDAELKGVEYQAICSGLHLVENDVIYFSRECDYGMAVFKKTNIEQERGALMHALGVICSHQHLLWKHIPFLREQLGRPDLITDQLEIQKDWVDYFQLSQQSAKQEPIHPLVTQQLPSQYLQPFDTMHTLITSYLATVMSYPESNSLSHDDPASSTMDLLSTFGPNIFAIWKSILARQRVMLIGSAPPMQRLCHFVHILSISSQLPSSVGFSVLPPRVKFNVGINEIDVMEMDMGTSYIACTSDTIFDIKTKLYDTLVRIPSPESASSHQYHTVNGFISNSNQKYAAITRSVFPLSQADIAHYQILCQHIPNLPAHPTLPSSSKTSLMNSDYSLYKCAAWLSGCGDMLQHVIFTEPPSKFRDSYHALISPIGSIHAMNTTIGNSPLAAQQVIDEIHIPSNDRDATDPNAHNLQGPLSQSLSEMSKPFTFHSESKPHLEHFIPCLFQLMSHHILSMLQSIIVAYDNQQMGPQPIVQIGLRDIIHLGLDPRSDQPFLMTLGRLYFDREIKLSCLRDISACTICSCSSGCCLSSQQNDGHGDLEI